MRVMSRAETMSTMTLEKATSLFMSMSHEQVNSSLLKMVKLRLSGQASGGGPTGYAAVDTARDMLNQMMDEAMLKKELEIIRCTDFETSTFASLQSLEQDISYVNSEASAARSEVLRAQGVIQILEEVKLPRNREELIEHNRICKADIASLEQQLYIVRSDIRVMVSILEMVCKDQNVGSSLLQLSSELEQGSMERCMSCLASQHMVLLQHGSLQPILNRLRSEISNGSTALTQSQATYIPGLGVVPQVQPQQGACNEQMTGDNASTYRGCQSETLGGKRCQKWTMQAPHSHTYTEANYPNGGLGDHDYCRNPGGYHTIWCYTEDPNQRWDFCQPMIQLNVPTGVSAHDCAQLDTCKLSQPNCDQLIDRFMIITSGLEDKRDELSTELSKLQFECKSVRFRYETTISTLESRLQEEQTALATATTHMTENQQLSVLSNTQHTEMNGEYHHTLTSCCTNKNAFTSEICALEKIRGELYRLEGLSVFISDCVVSDWVDEECSLSCGGGQQTRTRSVIVNPVNGSACPPKTMERSCNMEGCPIACSLDEWTGWSDCTADCDGGVKTRSRSKLIEPEHGGDPCLEQTQTQSCNTFACNTDCVLRDWSSWGICPKMCGGGHAERKRDIAVEKRGLGNCDAADSPERVDYQICNNFECKLLLPKDQDVLHCSAMIDVILVIDGSGSLGSYGWKQSKIMAEALVESMQGGSNGVNLGVLLFSGPKNWKIKRECVGEGNSGNKPTLAECGIQWVTHLNTDMVLTKAKTEEMIWPKRATLTSLALMEAKQELTLGRPEAPSVVIVITDGKPMNLVKTNTAATAVKESARLVFVPVGTAIQSNMGSLKQWASAPWDDNILPIDTFSVMNTPTTMNGIISGFCPLVS